MGYRCILWCCTPRLAPAHAACKGVLHFFCTLIMPFLLMCAGSWRLCQSECRLPAVLHPDSVAGPAASGSAAAPAIPGAAPTVIEE